MTGRSEVLFLAHRIPYPPDKGDKIRSWRLLSYLAERYDVHLACFIDDERDLVHRDFLRGMCKSASFVRLHPKRATIKSAFGLMAGKALSIAYYDHPEMRRAVAAARARPLAAEIAFSSTMAQYIKEALPGRPRIIDFCDADSEKWREYAGLSSQPMRAVYHREAKLLTQEENAIANWCDVSFAITPAEAILFNRRPPIRKEVRWFSNGVDTDYFNPAAAFKPVSSAADIVFTGAMDYRANVDAVLSFAETVWPLIRNAEPEARFAIVGARPDAKIRALDGTAGIIVTGRVEDVRPWLKGAKAVVAPLLVARGLQNKVLEAMAMAKPVVATHAAATGIVCEAGEHLLIADHPEPLAEAVVSLLHDAAKAERLGAAARALCLERYQWPQQLHRFGDALNNAISSARPAGGPAAILSSA